MNTTDTYTAEKLLRSKLDLLLRTGKLLMETSADTNRIMRNMKRTAAFLGLPEEHLHIFIDYNLLMVNFSNDTHSFSKCQRCDKHGINFTAISAISKLTFKAVRENYTMEQFENELQKIASTPRNYSPVVTAIFAALACGGFCIQFGCDWVAFFYASIAAYVGFRIRAYLLNWGMNVYMSIASAAFMSTIVAVLTSYLPFTNTPLHPLLACALFIVPGVPLINFVDDMLDNFLKIGMIRAANTAMIMIAMAIGIVAALKLCGVAFDFHPDILKIPMRPHHHYWEYALAAAISGVGFSMIFNIPKRLLWAAGLGGLIAVVTRNFVMLTPDEFCACSLGWGGAIGSFCGAALVSVLAVKAVHKVHTPNHILTISAVIPMVPGALMYRALFSLIQIPQNPDLLSRYWMEAGKFGVIGSTIVFCIALGVAIPNVFARRWVNTAKLKEFNQLVKEKKERGDFLDIEKF